MFIPRSTLIHLDAEGKEQSLVERYYLWDRAISVIKARPLTGTGINTYTKVHPKYDRTQNWRVRNYYAHNGYLQLAAEIGVFGLLAFLIFLGIFFIQGLRAGNFSDWDGQLRFGLLMGTLNFLIFVMADTVLHNPQPVMTFWFLLGLHRAYLTSKPAETL
ncbi:MAG: O-antigen ligase family protein [Candidatus Omnitrophica bacterium]|nr:O-antigen ligase family protein [Candidatus Omnitrophota bacterium]